MTPISAPPQPPKIASIPNLRDAGGYATRDGGRVRKGVLYRSEQLSRVTDEDMVALQALGLKRIYDLRTDPERVAEPDRVPSGAQDIVVNVLADKQQSGPAELLHLLADPAKAEETLGGGKLVQLFDRAYKDMVSLPSALAGYSRMFKDLADEANLPALYHCTTGKDRTGWTSAVLLTLCGVPEEEVLRDYLASNDYILPEYRPLIDKYVAAGIDEEILLSILGVREEYLQAAFREMKDQFGSIEEYLAKGLAIDAAGQQTLRQRFVE